MDNREIAQAAARSAPHQTANEVVVVDVQASQEVPEAVSQVVEQAVQKAKDQAEDIAHKPAQKPAEESSAYTRCQSRIIEGGNGKAVGAPLTIAEAAVVAHPPQTDVDLDEDLPDQVVEFDAGVCPGVAVDGRHAGGDDDGDICRISH